MTLKIAIASLAVLVVIIVAVGLMAYLRVIPLPGPILRLVAGGQPPEHSARYFPDDTLAYAWFSIAPSGSQLNDMMDLWERLNEFRAFEDAIDELLEELEDETGFDLENDVLPWMGPDASLGIISIDNYLDAPEAAIVFGVRDRDEAEQFLEDWTDYLDDQGAEFDDDSYGDAAIWVDRPVGGENGFGAYALSKSLLVWATDEDTLEDMIDRIDGDDDHSLANDDNFQSAQEAFPDRRFASIYIDTGQAVEVLEPLSDFFYLDNTYGNLARQSGELPDWIAVSATWIERGIVINATSPSVTETELETPDLDDPGRILPDDTLGYVAVAFDSDLDRWRDELGQYDLADFLPGPWMIDEFNNELSDFAVYELGLDEPPRLDYDGDLADALDLALWYGEELTGIDLEEEFFDYLTGTMVMAVRNFDFEDIEDDPENNPIHAVAMLSYDSDGEEDLRETMEDLTDLIVDYLPFVQSDDVDVGADEDAIVFPIEYTEYAPGYVLHEDYLIMGSTEDALETSVEQRNGNGTDLSSVSEYQRAVGNLSSERQFLAYIDLQSIIGQLDSDDMDLEPDEFRILEEATGAISISISTDDDYTRAAIALTLFPE